MQSTCLVFMLYLVNKLIPVSQGHWLVFQILLEPQLTEILHIPSSMSWDNSPLNLSADPKAAIVFSSCFLHTTPLSWMVYIDSLLTCSQIFSFSWMNARNYPVSMVLGKAGEIKWAHFLLLIIIEGCLGDTKLRHINAYNGQIAFYQQYLLCQNDNLAFDLEDKSRDWGWLAGQFQQVRKLGNRSFSSRLINSRKVQFATLPPPLPMCDMCLATSVQSTFPM